MSQCSLLDPVTSCQWPTTARTWSTSCADRPSTRPTSTATVSSRWATPSTPCRCTSPSRASPSTATRCVPDSYLAGRAPRRSRTARPALFIAANDGMLHAFNAEDRRRAVGLRAAHADARALQACREQLRRQPPLLRGRLADLHGRAATAATWRTILVGGLNAGGRGYYALDVTDTSAPKGAVGGLQRQHACASSTTRTSGYSYGKPIITKDSDGKWVVIVTSGYNNVQPR